MSSKSHHAGDYNTAGRKSGRRKPLQPQPAVSLLANSEAESSGKAHMVLEFLKPFGERGIVRVPREAALFDPRSVAREIAARNGDLPQSMDEACGAITTACLAKPDEFWLEVFDEGWRPDMGAFIYRGQVIGSKYSGRRLLKPQPSDTCRKYPLAQKGDIRQWHRIVRLASRSSRMRLAICAAFAAPLLRVVDLQPFMLVIFGTSKSGKTTCQLAAASSIGIGHEGALPNFNSTLAALQEVASEFNDIILPVNEIGLLRGTKRDAYSSLRSLVYRYSEGRDTGRHSKSQIASEAGLASWRGIMIASSENSVETLAAAAGEKRDEGEYARAFDVPAVRPGNRTIYDRFPRNVKPDMRETWARGQLVEIRELCAASHGLAFQHYAEFLIGNGTILRKEVEKAMKRFMTSLPQKRLSGALQHAARNFALIYAGAVMAEKAGLLPWKLEATRKALRTCFGDGLREIERSEGAEDRAQKALMRGIAELPPRGSVTDPYTVEGWHSKERGATIFTVRANCFHGWFRRRQDERVVLRWLHEKDLLELRDGAVPDFANTEWAETHQRQGGKNHRTFRFRDPR